MSCIIELCCHLVNCAVPNCKGTASIANAMLFPLHNIMISPTAPAPPISVLVMYMSLQ